MTEQEQAQVLARWLEQPAGTPPPEGLDPEVVESIYAMRPELAPEPALSADDILAGFDWGAGGVTGGEAADDEQGTLPGAAMPKTEVRSAPPAWRSANRVAGVAVILATAATLMLVVLPSNEPMMEAATQTVAPEADMAAAPARQRAPDPIASVADEEAAPEAEPEAVAAAPAPRPSPAPSPQVPQMAGGQAGGDAVVDANLEDLDDDTLDFASDQRTRFEGNQGAIPEVQEALEQEEMAWDAAPTDAPVAAAPSAAPEEDAGYGYASDDAEQADLYSGKGRANKRAGARRDQAAAEPAVAESADEAVSSRTAAVPNDFSRSAWRSAVDGGTESTIDAAVSNAQAELSLGNVDKAVGLLTPHISAPSAAGQYVAVLATEMQLGAGRVSGALSTVQAGLRLDSSNTAARAMLLKLYGDALDRAGDPAGAEAQWQAAAALNATR